MARHDWAAIRQAYESGCGTVTGIAAQFGISPPSIYRRIGREGWKTRYQRPPAGERQAMLQRLKLILEREVAALEGCLDEMTAPLPLAEAERLAKVAGALVKLLETVTSLELELEKLVQRAADGDAGAEEDDDELRQSLAARIAALREQHADVAGSAETGSE